MPGIHGEQFYGYVDHIPGVGCVATKFFHINFIPLIPLGSFIIPETVPGTPDGPQLRMGLSGKSLFAGYVRGWLGLATVALFTIASAGIVVTLTNNPKNAGGTVLKIACGALGFGVAVWAVVGSHRSWKYAWAILALVSVGFITAFAMNPPPPPPQPANPFRVAGNDVKKDGEFTCKLLIWANACLFTVSMVRSLDRPTRARAYEIGDRLGLSESTIDILMGYRSADAEDPVDEYDTADQRYEF